MQQGLKDSLENSLREAKQLEQHLETITTVLDNCTRLSSSLQIKLDTIAYTVGRLQTKGGA